MRLDCIEVRGATESRSLENLQNALCLWLSTYKKFNPRSGRFSVKWRTVILSMLVLPLEFALVSCEQMFSTNLFSSITQKTITAASIAGMTAAEIVALTGSADSMAKLAADQAAKDAALAKLAVAYNADPSTSDGQAAAMAAADISIMTVPDAAQFAASAINLVTLKFSTASATDIVNALTGILPVGIAGSIGSASQPPAAFISMVAAFTSASDAFTALNSGISGSPPAYADPGVTSAQKMEMAVNAVISAVFSTITPSSGTTAEALWSALCNPAGASGFLTFDPAVTSGPANLLTAAGLTL